MSNGSGIEPPRVASWAVELFAPIERSDAMLGDLREEFQAMARIHGGRLAKAWYWRQAAQTTIAMAADPFKSAAVATVGRGFAGILLAVMMASIWNLLEGRFVSTVPVYHFVSAAAFWGVADVLPWIAAGAIFVRRSRGQSLSVAAATPFLFWAMLKTGAARPLVMWVTTPGKHLQGLLAVALTTMLRNPMWFALWFLIGAVIGQQWRSRSQSAALRPSPG